MASSSTVPLGFHYETKYIVLSYLGLLSQEKLQEQRLLSSPQGVQPDEALRLRDQEVLLKIKTEIGKELRSLEKEISEAVTSTGFDRQTSPVLSPANPESSVEDCLVRLGEGVLQDLKEPLQKALRKLLDQPVTYQSYRECALETAAHASGWTKILVPLVLLQQMLLELTRRGQEPLSALLQFGVTYLEDCAAEDIIQQGGWGTVFTLESEEEEFPGIMAEDSNDIYILPSDNSGQISPPESPTVTTSWQSESLPVSLGPESWQQVAVDPEEVKSLDSNGAGEKSENNSSNSDIVHVEKEELPEGVEEATPAALLEMREPDTAMEKVSPSTSFFVVLDEEELKAATREPVGPEAAALLPTQPSEELPLRERSAGEEEVMALAQGKAALLFGGAAAVAILAMAVGVALALRRK